MFHAPSTENNMMMQLMNTLQENQPTPAPAPAPANPAPAPAPPSAFHKQLRFNRFVPNLMLFSKHNNTIIRLGLWSNLNPNPHPCRPQRPMTAPRQGQPSRSNPALFNKLVDTNHLATKMILPWKAKSLAVLLDD